MKKMILSALLFISIGAAFSQSKFPMNEWSVNGFRNPSIGLEYRHHHVSVHAGYYTTAFKSGQYTSFFKTGINYWFLPVGKKEIPSSFYAGVSFLRGLTRDYQDKNAVAVEGGFRWMIWKGLNVRMGAIALSAKGQNLKINPTPGISYSFSF